VDRGLVTSGQAEDFYAEGRRALDRLLGRKPPYDAPWEDWRPGAER
jgi:hypothetical protein